MCKLWGMELLLDVGLCRSQGRGAARTLVLLPSLVACTFTGLENPFVVHVDHDKPEEEC